MKVEFEKVVEGLCSYINKEVLPTMNTWQQVVATVAVNRYAKNSNNLKATLINNPIAKGIALVDENGMVEIDDLAEDIKAAIAPKGKLDLSIPVIGCKLTFNSQDISILCDEIKGVSHNASY